MRKDTLAYPDAQSMRTDVAVVPLTQLPAGFGLDTLFSGDSTLGYKVDAYYPKSVSNMDFNRQMERLLKKRIRYCRPDKTDDSLQYAYMDLWIVGFKQSAASIYCTFCEQTYYSGGAHYNVDTVRYTYHGKK